MNFIGRFAKDAWVTVTLNICCHSLTSLSSFVDTKHAPRRDRLDQHRVYLLPPSGFLHSPLLFGTEQILLGELPGNEETWYVPLFMVAYGGTHVTERESTLIRWNPSIRAIFPLFGIAFRFGDHSCLRGIVSVRLRECPFH